MAARVLWVPFYKSTSYFFANIRSEKSSFHSIWCESKSICVRNIVKSDQIWFYFTRIPFLSEAKMLPDSDEVNLSTIELQILSELDRYANIK